MKTIWKYQLDPTEKHQDIQMPRNSSILDVQVQDGELVFWALVYTQTPMKEHQFLLVDTGEEMPEGPSTYIGTVQDGPTVYHLFEEFEELPF